MSDTKKLSAKALREYPSFTYESWVSAGWTDEQLTAAGWLEAANEPSPTVTETGPPPMPSLEEAHARVDSAFNRVKMLKATNADPLGVDWKAASLEQSNASRVLAAVMARQPKDKDMAALDYNVQAAISTAAPDVFFLPNDHFNSVPIAAKRIFSYLGKIGELYRRGNAVVQLTDNGVEVLTATQFRARINERGRQTMAFKAGNHDGELYPAHKYCSEDIAKVLLSASAVSLLPEIKLIVSSPLLIEIEGQLLLAQPGYNANCGVLVTGTASVYDVSLDVAVAALLDLVRDFYFASKGDRSRGVMALIAPCIRMGSLIDGNALIDTVEADHSQAGKGTKNQLTLAIYNETPYPVSQRLGGVGSFDESLSAALMSGKPFISLDNLRGDLRSTMLEAVITPISSNKCVPVRLPHRGEVMVDASRTEFQVTSNGFSSTMDLANRLLITRLKKQPGEYRYHLWEGLGLLAHVKRYAMYYLSCVHAVVRYWHSMGKPILPTTHTFKEWVGSLDWIAQNVLGLAPLLEGHENAASRIASPSLSWLRQLAVLVLSEGKAGVELRAGDLREICERHSLMPDGVKPSWEDNAAERAIGKTMGSCFNKGDTIELDGIVITRIERKERYELAREMRAAKFYTFAQA